MQRPQHWQYYTPARAPSRPKELLSNEYHFLERGMFIRAIPTSVAIIIIFTIFSSCINAQSSVPLLLESSSSGMTTLLRYVTCPQSSACYTLLGAERDISRDSQPRPWVGGEPSAASKPPDGSCCPPSSHYHPVKACHGRDEDQRGWGNVYV